MTKLATFKEVVAARHSCRGFLPTPIDKDTITSVLEVARLAPSNCNTQPWHAVVVSGDKELSDAYVKAYKDEGFTTGTGDFAIDYSLWKDKLHERQIEQMQCMYDARKVTREDAEGREKIMIDNFKFYGAPHVALLFMPDAKEGNVRQASDIGQYAMTLMLSLGAHGVASVPQTILGMKPDVPRKMFPIPEGYKMLFGISFGHEDPGSTSTACRRLPCLRLYSFLSKCLLAFRQSRLKSNVSIFTLARTR